MKVSVQTYEMPCEDKISSNERRSEDFRNPYENDVPSGSLKQLPLRHAESIPFPVKPLSNKLVSPTLLICDCMNGTEGTLEK